MEEGDLGPLPTISPELECFLEMPTTSQGTRDRWDFLLEPSIRDYEQWLECQAHQLDTPYWWEELTTIPGVEDIKKLAQKICTSFDVIVVQYEVLRSQGYTVSPAPKCLKRGMFLPDDLYSQDIHLKPQQMALAYAQALQYWVEEANPLVPSEPNLLVMSVRELRWHIGKYTTFFEQDVFEGLGNALSGATVENTQPSPMGTPLADSTASSAMTDIKDT